MYLFLRLAGGCRASCRSFLRGDGELGVLVFPLLAGFSLKKCPLCRVACAYVGARCRTECRRALLQQEFTLLLALLPVVQNKLPKEPPAEPFIVRLTSARTN